MSSFWKRWGPHAEIMRHAAQAHPSLLSRLADAPDKTFHVYAIRLDRLKADEPDATPERVADILQDGTLGALLEASWGKVPDGTAPVLQRCGPDVWPSLFYGRLRLLLLKKRCSHLLRTARGPVTPALLQHIRTLAGLDPALDALRVRVSPDSLKALHWLLTRLREHGAAPDPKWLRERLKTMTDKNWQGRVLALLRLHPPVAAPWPGDALLRPLETPEALRQTSLEMHNCLDSISYALRLIRGRSAFYRWHGDEPAALEIRDYGGGAWGLEEANGINNDDLKPDTLLAIQRALAQGGICGLNDPVDRLVYGLLRAA